MWLLSIILSIVALIVSVYFTVDAHRTLKKVERNVSP